jgi:hypothetical protein
MPIEANQNFCFLFPTIQYDILMADASAGETGNPHRYTEAAVRIK